jgi:chromosome segregation ATPase
MATTIKNPKNKKTDEATDETPLQQLKTAFEAMQQEVVDFGGRATEIERDLEQSRAKLDQAQDKIISGEPDAKKAADAAQAGHATLTETLQRLRARIGLRREALEHLRAQLEKEEQFARLVEITQEAKRRQDAFQAKRQSLNDLLKSEAAGMVAEREAQIRAQGEFNVLLSEIIPGVTALNYRFDPEKQEQLDNLLDDLEEQADSSAVRAEGLSGTTGWSLTVDLPKFKPFNNSLAQIYSDFVYDRDEPGQ